MAAGNTYPDEFFSLLGGDRKRLLIDELVVVPAIYGRNYTLIKTYLMPFDSRIMGSVHSHPGHSAKPSPGDLNTFERFGNIHLIICQPFNIGDIAAYDRSGNRVEFRAWK